MLPVLPDIFCELAVFVHTTYLDYPLDTRVGLTIATLFCY
jgi:hypothetical protein